MNISMTAGASGNAAARTGNGLRRTTHESVRAGKLSKAYHQDGAPRWARTAVLRMLKLAGPRLGLNPIQLALVDVLFACSKPGDWTGHDRFGPIVWPSNILLARRMNMPVNTVRYHLRILGDLGIITWCDDAGYRRHGKRDADGRIIEAFGIDLSPSAMRHEEFTAIVEAAEEDARDIDRLRRRRTSLDKAIRSLVDSAVRRGLDDDTDGAFSHGMARRDVLCERPVKDLDELIEHVADFEELHDRLETLYAKASEPSETTMKVSRYRHPGVKMLTPITYTATKSDSVICSQNGIALTSDTHWNEAACGSMAFEKKPRANTRENKQATVVTDTPNGLPHGQSAVEVEKAENVPVDTHDRPGAPVARTEPDLGTQTLNGSPHHAGAGQAADPLPVAVAETATQDHGEPPDERPGEPVARASTRSSGEHATASSQDDDVLQLSIGLLRDACPAIEGAAPGALSHWQILRDSGHALCAGADINPQVFDEASNVLGPDIAIAATAVTVQKAAQGDIFKPGAYLRTLTKRGKAGELHIARSLHGLAARNAADHADNSIDDNSGNPSENRTIGQEGTPSQRPGAVAHDDGARGDGATTPPAAPKFASPFPTAGSIAYSPWAEIVRNNAPEPVPDVDRVADAFRAFCNRHAIDTTSPNIRTVFTTFCRKWAQPR